MTQEEITTIVFNCWMGNPTLSKRVHEIVLDPHLNDATKKYYLQMLTDSITDICAWPELLSQAKERCK